MKNSQLAKTLLTVIALPICGTALTAGAVQLEMVVNQDPVTQEPSIPALPIQEPPTEESSPLEDSITDVMEDSTPAEDSPAAKLDDSVTGWNGAEPAAGLNIGQTLRSSWVSLNNEGNLPGTVVSNGAILPQAKVFLVQNGRLASESLTNDQGQFLARGLEQGSYTVLVHAGDYYAMSGLIVLDNEARSANVQNQLTVSVTEASTLEIYNLLTSRATQVRFRDFGEYAFGETADDPARLYGIRGLATHKPESVPAAPIGNYRVTLSDGAFLGRLHAVQSATGRPVDLKSTEVILLKDNTIVHRTQTNRYGVFNIRGLEPGYYSLVSTGQDGVLAMGVELVAEAAANAEANARASSQHFVTTGAQDQEAVQSVVETEVIETVAPVSAFDGTLAPREDIGWINHYMLENPVYEEVIIEDIVSSPCGTGMNDCCGYGAMDGCGGGGFGGAGGLGLGCGGGGFLPLAAAIGAIALIDDDDDDRFRTPVPISPFRP